MKFFLNLPEIHTDILIMLSFFMDQSRRAFSMRFIGDDVKYIRGGLTSPNGIKKW